MKIFVISFQRNGTTSTGKFFSRCGYKVATWNVSVKNKWTQKWFNEDYDSIFQSNDFKNCDVFEDDPWWCQNFYELLFFKFPDSQFVLVERESDKWFDSMLSRGKGKSLGNTRIHSKLYQREKEFEELTNKSKNSTYNNLDIYDKLLPLNDSHRKNYIEIYEKRNLEIKSFFNKHDKTRLIHVTLEDDSKWEKIANHFNIKNYPKQIWENKSK